MVTAKIPVKNTLTNSY